MSPGRTHKARESRGSPPVRIRAGRYRCAPDDLSRILQSEGFAGGVPPKHRKNHRETVGWYRKIARGVCSLLKWRGPGGLNEKCTVNIAQCLPALNFSARADHFSEPEFRFAVLMDETVIATSSLASVSKGAAVCRSTLPVSTKSSTQYPDSSASSSTSPNLEMKAGLDLARQAAR